VVIIGGTSGMGLATAKMLLDGGARVLVTGRSQGGLDSAQQELGEGAVVVSSDARSLRKSTLSPLERGPSSTPSTCSSSTLGFSIRAPLESMTEAVYDEMFNLKRQGAAFRDAEAHAVNKPWRLYRPHDLDRQRQGNARQCHIRSGQGCAAIIRSDAGRRVDSREIRVNAVTPAPIDTPIIGKAFPSTGEADQIREKMTGMVPMKRFGTSDEIAKAVLFLAFDATFTTGAELPVDGGWSQL